MALDDVLNKKVAVRTLKVGETPEYRRAISYTDGLINSNIPVTREAFRTNVAKLFPNLSSVETGRLVMRIFGSP